MGLGSYDFWLDFDESKFDYVEGSFTPASGTTNAGAENTVNGESFLQTVTFRRRGPPTITHSLQYKQGHLLMINRSY